MNHTDIHEAFRVRASDPVSSAQAASNAAIFAGSHKARVVAALSYLGEGTAHDISKVCGLTIVQVDRRLPELKRDDAVKVLCNEFGMDIIRDGFRVWALKNFSA